MTQISFNDFYHHIVGRLENLEKRVGILERKNAFTLGNMDGLYECEQCKNFFEPDESGKCPHCGFNGKEEK